MTHFALITGGSSGIGWAIALELAQRQYPIVLVSNQEEALKECQTRIERDFGVACHVLNLDLAQPSAAQSVFDFCQSKGIEVEILVNNAGVLLFSEVASAPVDKMHIILQLHVYTPTMLCRLFGAQMRERRSGHILNVSSISSVMPYPGISIYGPTKTYMRYFSRALRSEMRLYNVNVTCLIPGATQTALYDPNRVNLSLAKKVGVMATAEFVARRAVRAMFRRCAQVVPGFLNKLTMWFVPWVPAWIIVLIHRKTNLIKKGEQHLG